MNGSSSAQDARTDSASQLAAFEKGDVVTPARRRAMITIALGEFLDGYDLIVIAGALLQLNQQFHLTPSETGLLGASAFFGAAGGLLVAGSIADRLGRRAVFINVFWIFAIVSLLSAFIVGYWQLFLARLVLGVLVGADIAVSIPFLGEIAPKASRGRWAGALPQIAWTAGAISSLILAVVLIQLLGAQAWRWLFGLGAIPAVIILIGRYTVPESPRWLFSKGRSAEAKAAMRAFGLSIAEIGDAGDEADALPPSAGHRPSSYADIFRAPHTHRALLAVIVSAIGPLTGSAASVAAPYVMHFVGLLGSTAALEGSVLIWVGGLAGSLIAAVTLDRVGRIRSSAISMWANSACLVLLVLTVRIPPLFVMVYMCYGVSVWFGASSTWLLPTELLPTHLRSRAQGLASGLTRLSIGLTTWLVPTGIAAIGFSKTFFGLALIGLALGCYILTKTRFETSGRSLDSFVG